MLGKELHVEAASDIQRLGDGRSDLLHTSDGGDVELVDVNDGVVKLKLRGACAGCPMSTMTLRQGIERILKEEVPEVKEVVAV